jgi:hypothetical protein
MVLGLLALLVTACATPQRAKRDADNPIGMPLPTLLNLIQRGEPVLDDLPEPEKVAVEQRQNRHDPTQTDLVRTLVYPGLTLTVYEPEGSGRRLISQLTVTSEDYRTPQGLRVGSTLQDLSNALGEADRLEGDEYVYLSKGPAPDVARFRIDGDRITRIQWNFYID